MLLSPRIFIVLNLLGVCSFIFVSALYFPPVSSSRVLAEANAQRSIALAVEVPRVADGYESNLSEHKLSQSSRNTIEVEANEATMFAPPRDEKPRAVATIEQHVRTESPTGHEKLPEAGEIEGLPVDALEPTAAPARTAISSMAFMSSAPLSSAPSLPTPTGQSHSISDIIRKIKLEAAKAQTIPPTAPTKFKTALDTHDALRPSAGGSEVPDKDSPGEDMSKGLVMWLKGDEGVEVENLIECHALGISCEVKEWRSLAGSAAPIVFTPVDSIYRPVLLPMAQNGRSVVALSCPMSSADLALHERMTVFFVLAPTEIEPGDTYRRQKFFGNSPYGQFLFHGGKPAFFTAGGLKEINSVVRNDEFAVLVYRLHRRAVEIKINGAKWGTPDDASEAYVVRMSANEALNIGNVKNACDSNSFRGKFAEILVYEDVLSNDRVDQVESYLQAKWRGVSPHVPDPQLASVAPTETEPQPALNREVAAAPPQYDGELHMRTSNAEPPISLDLTDDTAVATATVPSAHSQTFDPEGVFEWVPTEDLLAVVDDAASRSDQWKKAVSERVSSIRSFQLGGEVLRTFIRSRRDELIRLRLELFG